jgi:PAS domain S-box-containing protein
MEQRNESGNVDSVRQIRWHQSLTFQLGLTWTLITLLSILVLGVALIGIAQRTQEVNILQQQEKSASQVALLISSYINGVVNELTLFEGLQPLSTLTPEEQKTALEQLLIQRRTTFSQIVLLAKNGRERAKVSTTRTYSPADLGSQADSEAFRAAIDGETYISPIFVSPESGLLSVQVGIPVKATGGQVAGVLVAEANVARLWQDVSRVEIGQSGYAYLVDAEGRFLAYQEPSAVLQRYGEDMRRAPTVSDFVAGVQKEQTLLEYTGLNGQKVVGLFTPIPGTDWAAIVELPTQEAFASVRQMQIYLFGLLVLGLGLTVGLGFLLLNRTLRPILQLTDVAREVGQGNLAVEAPVRTKDEVGVLATVFNSMTTQLRQTLEGLEQKVAERTRALQTSAEISRRLSSLTSERELTVQVVEQLKSAFNYYHAHIYLLDEDGETLRMAGGTGEVGKTLLERGHSLPPGKGLVGRAAQTRQVVLVPETHSDPNWLPNPLLPETQAEIAVPILAGDTVLGVLDVQNNAQNSLTVQDAELIQSIADQVAIALQNIRANARAREAAESLQRLVETSPVGIAVLDAESGVFLEANDNALAMFDVERSQMGKVGPIQLSPPTQPDGRDSAEKATEEIRIAMQTGTHIFEWLHCTAQGREFLAEIRLTRAVDASGRTVLNAILTDITERRRQEEQARRRAQQQEALNRITQSIQRAARVEEALQIAARELGHALGRKPTLVNLEPPVDAPHQAVTSETGKG